LRRGDYEKKNVRERFLLGQKHANASSAGGVPTQAHKSPFISSGKAHSNVILSEDQLAFIKWD